MNEENYYEIDLTEKQPTLAELLELARFHNVIIKTKDQREYVLAKLEVFDRTISVINDGRELYNFMLELAKPKKAVVSKR
jgi:small nuclear ribonucleoprotein (snRNP)-like protein